MSFSEIIKDLNWGYLLELVKAALPALICVMFHELAHGYAAYKMGDKTAKMAGRLSLNPLRHIDPIGLVCMAVLRFGWAKPVPVNMFRFKNPKRGMALTALAGPAANFLITFVFLSLWALSWKRLIFSSFGRIILEFLYTTAYLSLYLAVFNLIPIPPLDGSKIAGAFLPDKSYLQLMRYERYGMIIMAAVVFSGIISKPISRAVNFIFEALFSLLVR